MFQSIIEFSLHAVHKMYIILHFIVTILYQQNPALQITNSRLNEGIIPVSSHEV